MPPDQNHVPDPLHPPSQPPLPQSQQTLNPPSDRPAAIGGQRVIQPTAAILKEAQEQPISLISTPARPQPQTPTQALPQPAPNQAIGSTGLPTNGKDKDYNPSASRVCERATSLKLYAIVTLIFSVLGLLTAIGIVSSLKGSTPASVSSTDLVSLLTRIVPIVGGAVYLLSKSIVLVKAFLIVTLINYAVGLIGFALIFFEPHVSIQFSPISLVAYIIPIIFLIWTWSVYAEVGLLSE